MESVSEFVSHSFLRSRQVPIGRQLEEGALGGARHASELRRIVFSLMPMSGSHPSGTKTRWYVRAPNLTADPQKDGFAVAKIYCLNLWLGGVPDRRPTPF